MLLLALGCDDNKIRIFCSASVTEDYKMTQVISGHSDWIRSVTFGSTGDS